MHWLVALASFAGIMAVLSTVVTVAVEAMHKLFSLRRSGLQEMLRAMHERVVSPLEAELGDADQLPPLKQSDRFAKEVTLSPAWGGRGRWWWIANWPINLFQRRFERLTKRQLAEQLSQTEFGKRLALQDRASIKRTLAQLSYEFDRLGVAQSDYFRRRAKVLSGITAFAFVAFGNINAISIYRHLAANEVAAGRTAKFVEEALQLEALKKVQDNGTTSGVLTDYATAIDEIQRQTELPIGQAYWPICNDVALKPAGDAGNGAKVGDSNAVEPPKRPIDPMCVRDQRITELVIPFTEWEISAPISRLLLNGLDGIVWFLSIVATAGLLALGAPFWFDTFNKLAAMTGGRLTNLKAQADVEDKAAREAAKQKLKAQDGNRGAESPSLDELANSLLISTGQAKRVLSAESPEGVRIGDASADLIASHGSGFKPTRELPATVAIVPSRAGTAPAGMGLRQLPGTIVGRKP